MKRTRLALLLVLGMVAALLPMGVAPAAADTPTELFMSEYIEGSSYNKAIEIYNGTGATVDLAGGMYTLELYSNGSAAVSQSMALSGSIADGDVYVLAHTSADAAIKAEADTENGSVINFNGDDTVVLRKNGAIVDAIGQIGTDPGSQWGADLASTKDNTIRRSADVCAGDTDGSDAFDPSIEWVGFANNTFDGLGSHTTACGPVDPIEPKINEFSASTTSTDVEYVEILGEPGTDYSSYTILEIEGDGAGAGVVDEVISLGSADTGGFYLVSLPANALENGTISLLLVEGFSGSLGDDLDGDNDGTLDATPWTALADSVAVTDGGTDDRTYGTPALGPNFDGVSQYAPGGASRIPDGFDTESSTDWVRNDFDLYGIPGYAGSPSLGEAENTPDAANSAITVLTDPIGVCGDPATLIHDIQGGGLVSGDVGSIREIEGIVVGDFQGGSSFNGFHVQEEDSDWDADALTSEGVFVYDSANGTALTVGDVVRVRGSVAEYNGLTEINNVETVHDCGFTGSASTSPVALPLLTPDDFEAYEGMLVTFAQALVISEYYNYGRYGEIVLTSDRELQPTAEFEPGAAAIAAAEEFLLNRITLDDGRSTQNPDPAIHPNGGAFDLANLFRGGDTLANVTGVVDYAYGAYKIQPTQGADYTNANPRTAAPDSVGGNLTVASFNVLNYFTTLGSRGADTPEEFTRQRDKIFSALEAMDADVVGLIEIENNTEAIVDLVAGLNALVGAGTYEYIDTGAIGDDAIKVAYIYKPATVSPVGGYAILDDSVDPTFNEAKNRPVLAQTFKDNESSGIFTVAVNHFKSKGSDCDALGDPDLGDGAGNCNLTRTAAAEALVNWLETDPTSSGDEDFLIIGDLNSYDKEDPIDAILAGGYTDLIYDYLGEDAYSYVFDGQIGYLDHALANEGMAEEITGATVWHINADEANLIDYDMSYKQDAQDAIYAPDAYRSSDHDPVIIGLDVCDEIAPTFTELSVTPDVLRPPNHKYVVVEATVEVQDNLDPNPSVVLLSVTSSEPDNGYDDGNTTNDIVIVDEDTFWLRAERSGVGVGRTYTITYEVTDDCGNATIGTATVFVPLNRKGGR